MIAIDDLALLRPLWLLGVGLAVALAVLVAARGSLGDWRRAVDPALLAALAARGAVDLLDSGGRRLSAAALAAVLVALALAGPAIRRESAESWRNLDGLLLAFDVSRSVTEGGSLPEARLAAMQVVEAAGTRQTGLVVYAGDAYLAATFTADRLALGQLVAALGPDLVPEAGSDTARAIRLAEARFAAAATLAGDLVLVTDGAGLDRAAETATAKLRAAGHRLHVLFVPAPARPDGAPPPDRAAATRLARIGGGLVADVADPSPLAAAVAAAPLERLARSDYRVLAFADLGHWLLLAAAVPVLLLFRRRA